MLAFADAQWPPVCASRRAGSALPACFKYRFLRFTRDTLSEGDDVLALFSQSSLPQWNHNAIVVGSHFGYEREKKKKKSLAATDDARLRNVQASANQGKKCLLAKLVTEEENRNVRRHVGEEEEKKRCSVQSTGFHTRRHLVLGRLRERRRLSLVLQTADRCHLQLPTGRVTVYRVTIPKGAPGRKISVLVRALTSESHGHSGVVMIFGL